MSGISGSWLGGQRDLSPAEDKFYGEQIARIRAGEKPATTPKQLRRRPSTQRKPKPDRNDDGSDE